jgi:ParB family chromosome partitioning protein
LAEVVGRSRSAVSNLVRLLDLPPPVLLLVDSKKISMGHARALLGLEDAAERMRLGQMVVDRDYSVRETEQLVRKTVGGESGAAAPKKRPEAAVVSEVLRTAAVRVELRQESGGAGKLIVEFEDVAARDALIAAIKGAVTD